MVGEVDAEVYRGIGNERLLVESVPLAVRAASELYLSFAKL